MIIFVVDDSPSVLSFLKKTIETIDNCKVLAFLDPSIAIGVLRTQQADLILVDYNMPGIDGVELISQVRQIRQTDDVPIIMLTSETDQAIKIAAIQAGATEFLTKPIDIAELSIRIRNLLGLRVAQRALAVRASELERDVNLAMARIAAQEKEIIWRLSKAMACRDGETALHLERVAVVAKMIAEELGLDETRIESIYLASPLHDVGKIGVSDAVLLKAGPLNNEEMAEMRAHAAFGAEILSNSSSQIIRTAAIIAESHHEKWNGTGYPHGISGAEIPVEGRIVAIADVFDALCSERPYKTAWPVDEAHREILRGSGTHFDPDCVEAFSHRWPQIRPLYIKMAVPHCDGFTAHEASRSSALKENPMGTAA